MRNTFKSLAQRAKYCVCVVPALLACCQQLPTKTPALTQPADPRQMLSFRAAADHEPDADPAGGFWQGIPAVSFDTSVMGDRLPDFRAEVRSRWTADYLYVLYSAHTQQFTLKPNPDTKAETPRLWYQDVFEFYIVGDANKPHLYREFQVSPQAEFLDNNIDATVNRPGLNGEDAWNSGFTVNARMERESKVWHGEMKIPLKSLVDGNTPVPREFLINFYRQDNPLVPTQPNAIDPRPRMRVFLAWQPPGVWNPHHPEKFGTLRLVEMPAR